MAVAKGKLPKDVIKNAKEKGMLPHEIMLKAARGEMFIVKNIVVEYYKTGPKKGQEKKREWYDVEYWPTYEEQLEAARNCAPFYAPRLATQTVVKKEENVKHNVMLVPTAGNAKEWGKTAKTGQKTLKKTVRE